MMTPPWIPTRLRLSSQREDAAARSCAASSPTPPGPPPTPRPRLPPPTLPGLPPPTPPGEVPDKVHRPLGHCRRCIDWGKQRYFQADCLLYKHTFKLNQLLVFVFMHTISGCTNARVFMEQTWSFFVCKKLLLFECRII